MYPCATGTAVAALGPVVGTTMHSSVRMHCPTTASLCNALFLVCERRAHMYHSLECSFLGQSQRHRISLWWAAVKGGHLTVALSRNRSASKIFAGNQRSHAHTHTMQSWLAHLAPAAPPSDTSVGCHRSRASVVQTASEMQFLHSSRPSFLALHVNCDDLQFLLQNA